MSINKSEQGVKTILQPLRCDKNQPVFDEQWQAQALAMADLLIQSEQVSANQWSQTLGKHLNVLQTGQADNQLSYYQAVLNALEELIQQNKLLTNKQIGNREQAWKKAYLSTPHGQPVELSK